MSAETVVALIGAGAGAALAFAFFLLGETILKAYQRVAAGRNALVALERVLNDQLDAAYVSGNHALQAREILAKGAFVTSLPRPIELPPGLDADLMDRECVNRLFSLKVLLRRYNHDAENLRDVHERLVTVRIDGKLSAEVYAANARQLGEAYEKVGITIQRQYADEVEILLARTRVLLDRAPSRVFRFVGFISRTFLLAGGGPPTPAEVEEERRRLHAEVEATIERGRPSDYPGAISPKDFQSVLDTSLKSKQPPRSDQ